MGRISRLDLVSIRNVWPREERDFTPWLEKNIDLLAEKINITLISNERETKVGKSFRADLLAEGPDSELIVIENQFGKSDHDHLGKIITYLTNLDAKKAIWICEEPQPEHIAAVDWFNKHSPPDMGFYLVKLEAYQIENSPVAPLFTIVSEPSELIKEASEISGELAERHIKRHGFWEQLLAVSNSKTQLFSCVSASGDNWISAGSGIGGVPYQYVITMKNARIQLTMETSDKSRNKRIFDALFNKKEAIEQKFGSTLKWERRKDLKSSIISKKVSNKGLSDDKSWSGIIEKMTDEMVNLENTFHDELRQISI